jgi:hypothetical protein
MKVVKTLAAAAAVLFALALVARADKADTKEVTVKGAFVCTKCTLKETDDCGDAIQVKDGDKTVTYYIKDNGKAEDYHKKFCTAKGVTGSVTGVVTEDKGKKYITPSKDGVKFD